MCSWALTHLDRESIVRLLTAIVKHTYLGKQKKVAAIGLLFFGSGGVIFSAKWADSCNFRDFHAACVADL